MELEDEDVVLHRSPLDQYLEEVTNEDFERYQPEPRFIAGDKLANADREIENNENSFLSAVSRYFDNSDTVESFHSIQSCCVLLNSIFLSEGDQQLLIDLCEEINKVKVTNEMKQTTKQQSTETNVKDKGLLCGVVVFLISLLFPMVTDFTESISWTWIILYILFIVLIMALYYYNRKRTESEDVPNDILENVETLLDLLSSYDKLVDKVIRHIKEVEVITHGYSQMNILKTLSHQQSSIKNGKRCLKLRSALMDGLTELFNQIRINVRIILGNKLNTVFDYKEEYVALMPLDAFSQVLYSTEKNESGICLTPLDQLKAAICLYRIQLSEYIYIMTISLFAYHHDKNNSKAKDICFAIEDTVKNLFNIHKTLEEQYLLSIKMVFSKERNTTERKIQALPMMSEILHSSEVHLYAALARIKEMSVLFENNDTSIGNFPTDGLHALTNQFNLSLENAKFCIEDVVEKVLPINTSNGDVVSTKPATIHDEKEDNYVLFTPPVAIGDMLYEGESELAARRESGMLNMDDISNSLKESRESRKLMRELKTILSVKESPVGLVAFPLTKVDENPISDTEEYVCEEKEVKFEEMMEKKIQKSAYTYNPSEDEDDEKCGEGLPRIQPMGLPLGLLANLPLKNNLGEVTFGCSSDDDSNDDG